jgi:hypothetical protein
VKLRFRGADRAAKYLGNFFVLKPFDVMQEAGVETAIMSVNLRAREKALRDAQYAAQGGHIDEALRHLGTHVVEAGNGAAVEAAAAWLSLSPAERETTSIYASGRALRGEVNEAVQNGWNANGELGPVSMRLGTLSRINVTREELRYARCYAAGTVVEVDRRQRAQGLRPGRYRVVETDIARERASLENERGRRLEFRPGQLRPQGEQDPLRLFEVRTLDIHAGDRIRWTETDHKRGLLNADQARITAIDGKSVTLKTSLGAEHTLGRDDPMLERLDLAYALNAHMAQGMTKAQAIEVISSAQRTLATQRTQNVLNTRATDDMMVVTNNLEGLKQQLDRTPGNKTSALEVTGKVEVEPRHHNPVDARQLPELKMSPELKAKLDAVLGKVPEPPVRQLRPEKSLGLDL